MQQELIMSNVKLSSDSYWETTKTCKNSRKKTHTKTDTNNDKHYNSSRFVMRQYTQPLQLLCAAAFSVLSGIQATVMYSAAKMSTQGHSMSLPTLCFANKPGTITMFCSRRSQL